MRHVADDAARPHFSAPAFLCASSFVFRSVFISILISILAACGAHSRCQNSSQQKSQPAFALQWGELSLAEVDAEKGLLPSSPRILDANYFAAREQNIVPPLQILNGGNVVGTWGSSVASLSLPSSSPDFKPGTYSPEFSRCKIAPVLEPLLLALQNLATPPEEAFPKPVSLPSTIAALSSCELQSALTCFASKVQTLTEANAVAANAVQKGHALTTLANTFKDCARLAEFDPQTGFIFLRISTSDIAFSPSPLYAVSIYEGVLSDYDKALVSSQPAAGIAADSTCGSLSQGCLVSPLPLSRCPKCSQLKTGTLYTAFLLKEARERHQDIRHVVFKITGQNLQNEVLLSSD